jgi:hypothetical protein
MATGENMSMSILTMGMYGGRPTLETIKETIIDRGSSGYGYKERQPKPQVIVRRVETDEMEAEIQIILLHMEET